MRTATKIGCTALAALACAGSALAAVPTPPELPVIPALPPVPASQPPPVELPPVPVPVPLPPLPSSPSASVPVPVIPAAEPARTAAGPGVVAFQPLVANASSTERSTGAEPAPRAGGSTTTRQRETSIRSGQVRRTGRSIELEYFLARSGRVFVVLRGPVPSCTVSSRFSVRGQRGSNVLRFNGKVGRTRLATGTYLIGLRTAASSMRWKLIAVAPRAVRPVRRAAEPVVRACAAQAMVVHNEIAADRGSAKANGLPPRSSDRAQSPPSPPSLRDHPRPSVLPFVGVEEAVGELPSAAAAIVLVLLLASLMGIGVFVVRFLRTT